MEPVGPRFRRPRLPHVAVLMAKVIEAVISRSGSDTMSHTEIEECIRAHGFDEFAWMDGRDVRVAQWVRFKCRMMCEGYGVSAMCPPNMPSVEECREFFGEYRRIALLHLELDCGGAPDEDVLGPVDEALLALEREAFLRGYEKAMVLPMTVCYRCRSCSGSVASCREKAASRPNPEALGVDVFATARALGFPIEVLDDVDRKQNRYAMLLLE